MKHKVFPLLQLPDNSAHKHKEVHKIVQNSTSETALQDIVNYIEEQNPTYFHEFTTYLGENNYTFHNSYIFKYIVESENSVNLTNYLMEKKNPHFEQFVRLLKTSKKNKLLMQDGIKLSHFFPKQEVKIEGNSFTLKSAEMKGPGALRFFRENVDPKFGLSNDDFNSDYGSSGSSSDSDSTSDEGSSSDEGLSSDNSSIGSKLLNEAKLKYYSDDDEDNEHSL